MDTENQIKLDVVDTQIHIGPGKIEETMAAMDALGIQSVLIDEYWLQNYFNYDPHQTLEHGIIRPVCPTAELAAFTYPERFAWVLRVNREDPEYEAIIRMVRDANSGKGIRIIPGMSATETKAFAEGRYAPMLKTISDCGLPLFLHLPDQPELIAACAKNNPDLQIVVDHCGLFTNAMRAMGSQGMALNMEEQLKLYDRVLALSDFPNIALKWAHYSAMFDICAFPGAELVPVLRKTISAFGAERIMWASDFSVNQMGENWSELLYSVKGNFELSQKERAAILGGTARAWLNWDL